MCRPIIIDMIAHMQLKSQAWTDYKIVLLR